MPTINELYHRRGYGFLTEDDLKELVAIDRMQACLVRCGNGRFSAPAQDIQHFVDIVTASGKDHVRDVSILFSGFTPAKPGPLPKSEMSATAQAIAKATAPRDNFVIPSNGVANTDPLNMTEEAFQDWVKCLSNPRAQDSWKFRRREKQKRQEAAAIAQAERANHDNLYLGPNGPTGHGDICHSDADPGL
jgi:hypothetical protein